MKKRFYFYIDKMRWIYDAAEEETEESMRLKSVIAIARYFMENPNEIQIKTEEEE